MKCKVRDALKLTARELDIRTAEEFSMLNLQIRLKFPFSVADIHVFPETFPIDNLGAYTNVSMTTDTLRSFQPSEDFTTIDSEELVVEPTATVGLGLNSAAAHDISDDSHLHCVGVERIETVVGRAVRTSISAGHGIYWRVVGKQRHLCACWFFGECSAFRSERETFDHRRDYQREDRQRQVLPVPGLRAPRRGSHGGFSNLALGQQCAWDVPGDFSVPERDDAVHCWEGGKICDASNAVPETKLYKSELLSQEEVQSRGFVWNGNSSDLSSLR